MPRHFKLYNSTRLLQRIPMKDSDCCRDHFDGSKVPIFKNILNNRTKLDGLPPETEATSAARRKSGSFPNTRVSVNPRI